MYLRGVRTFIEIGAGGTLTDLVGQILGAREHVAVTCDRKGKNGVTSLYEALARLAVNGVPMNFVALWEAYAPPKVETAKKPGLRTPKR